MSISRGPLSWQQESMMGSGGAPNEIFEISLEIPSSVTEAELIQRVRRLVQREPALRIIGFDHDGVVYDEEMQPPIEFGSDDFIENLDAPLVRNSGEEINLPMWHLAVSDREDSTGGHRKAIARFNHFIVDRDSANLIRGELETGIEADPRRGAGSYRDWVVKQRRDFDPSARNTDTRRFWTNYLDADWYTRRAPVSFCAASYPVTGHAAIRLSKHVAISRESVQSACMSLKSTPLAILIAAIVATVSNDSGENDITLQIITSGRNIHSTSAIGWLSNYVPIRISGENLQDFPNALSASKKALQAIVRFQDTPAAYLDKMYTETFAPSGVTKERQIVVNLFSEIVSGLSPEDFSDQRFVMSDSDFTMSGTDVGLLVAPMAEGGYIFRLDGASSDPTGTEERKFLQSLTRRFTEEIGGLRP
ncbi:condensation domain-containing protein [Streptomyces sp. NPDC093065]|uniref:condensation domain-containing protein n=1 Tax=Streptomyces sp. NPDC093065 TaxID=3366021 RepID=UPI0037FC6620